MTIKLLTIGDLHFAGRGPAAYRGDYKADLLEILHECAYLAYDNQCVAVLMLGDLTHSHVMSTAVLTEFVGVLKKFLCPVLTIAGNHDRETSSLGDLKAAPYGLLREAGVIRDVYDNGFTIGSSRDAPAFKEWVVIISGAPYNEHTDENIYQYAPFALDTNRTVTIHLTHGMLLPDHPWWITDPENKADKDGKQHKYTTFAELAAVPKEQRPHIIINGHLHDGHPATFIDEKTLVVNFGAVCRLSRSVSEIERTLQVGLVCIESPEKYWAEGIVLKSQRPGSEVLDREILVREIERKKNKDKMAEYLELLGSKREIRVRDAREEIGFACKELGLPGAVQERCLRRLDKVSSRLEGEDKQC